MVRIKKDASQQWEASFFMLFFENYQLALGSSGIKRGRFAKFQGGLFAIGNHGFGDHAAANILAAWQLKQRIQQRVFNNGPEAARAAFPFDSQVRNLLEGVVLKDQFRAVQFHQL